MRGLLLTAAISIIVGASIFPHYARADATVTPATNAASGKSPGDTPLRALCADPERTPNEILYLKSLESQGVKCPSGTVGLLDAGAYGYEHPTPAYCNAGNGMKTGLLGFITGQSIGNKNIIAGIGTLLSMLFAGCNNAPPQSTMGLTAPSSTSTSIVTVPTHAEIVLTVSKSQPILVSEAGYTGDFVAVSADTTKVTVANPPASVAGGKVFTATALAAGSTSITISDAKSNTATVTINIQ